MREQVKQKDMRTREVISGKADGMLKTEEDFLELHV